MGEGTAKGLAYLAAHREKMSRERGADFIPRFIIRSDGDVGRFRHMLEQDNVALVPLHEVPTTTKTGKTIRLDTLCERDYTFTAEGPEFSQEKDQCTYCSSTEEKVSNIWWKGITWVYVYGIFHENRTSWKGSNEWQTATRNGAPGFIEEVNSPQLMVLRSGIGDKVYEMAGRFTTLLDRDYDLIRNGQRRQPFYDMIQHDPSPEQDKVREARGSMPDIMQTVREEFGGQKKQEAPAATPTPAANGAEAPAAEKPAEKPADEPVTF